jgi:peptide/nickel transport system permease protein
LTISASSIEQSATAAVGQVARGGTRLPSVGRYPRLYIGGALVLLLVLTAIFAPIVSPHDPIVGNVSDGLQAPSFRFWLGTDDQGRDVLSRVIWGSRISLSVGLI